MRVIAFYVFAALWLAWFLWGDVDPRPSIDEMTADSVEGPGDY